MKITNRGQLKHGMRVRCSIDGVVIENARVSDSTFDTESFYICHNEANVYIASGVYLREANRFGYKKAWCVYFHELDWIESLEPKTWDTLEVGDVLVNDGYEHTVLAVCDRLTGVSNCENPDKFRDWYTKEEFIRCGYTIKQDVEPEEEESIKDRIERLEKEVKDLKLNITK